jgi:hypothetical protein
MVVRQRSPIIRLLFNNATMFYFDDETNEGDAPKEETPEENA